MRAEVRAYAHAARRAGYAAGQLAALLGETLLPLLRVHHPGPVGDWLWEHLVLWAREDYADAAAAAPPEPHVAALEAPAGAGPDASPTRYRLDARDVVTAVDAAWGDFAAANGAPALPARVVGTSLWAHIGGAETQALYGAVHAAVRGAGRPVTLPFRCDAPEERRWMRLTVRPLGGGHLEVASTLVRRAGRPRVPLLDPAVPRGTGELPMCSWCKRVRPGEEAWAGAPGPDGGAWVDVEALPAGGGDPAGVPRLAHAVCPACAAGVRAALAGL